MNESINLFVGLESVVLIISILASFGVIKLIPKYVLVSYKISLILFFVFYLFIIEYRTIYWWSIWSISPFNVLTEVSSENNWIDLHRKINASIEYFTSALMIFSIPLFIQTLNSRIKNHTIKFLNWIPILNLLPIIISLKNIKINIVLLTTWSIFTLTWFFYRFIAPLLLYNGIDSYNPLRKIFYSENFEAEYPFDLITLNIDTAFIVLPVLMYLSAITSFIIFINMSKSNNLFEFHLQNKYNVIDDE